MTVPSLQILAAIHCVVYQEMGLINVDAVLRTQTIVKKSFEVVRAFYDMFYATAKARIWSQVDDLHQKLMQDGYPFTAEVFHGFFVLQGRFPQTTARSVNSAWTLFLLGSGEEFGRAYLPQLSAWLQVQQDIDPPNKKVLFQAACYSGAWSITRHLRSSLVDEMHALKYESMGASFHGDCDRMRVVLSAFNGLQDLCPVDQMIILHTAVYGAICGYQPECMQLIVPLLGLERIQCLRTSVERNQHRTPAFFTQNARLLLDA